MGNEIAPTGVTWVDAIRSIPGAVKAISQLVAGLGGAGAAGLDVIQAKWEGQAADIRGETESRGLVREEVTTAAIKKIAGDDQLAQRALTHWVNEEIRKQNNRESIARKAVEELEHEKSPEGSKAPDDDWMNMFSRFAEDANSDWLQEIWAKILAGEIRKPGAFSLRTLQTISALDQDTISQITESCRILLDGKMIPAYGELQRGPKYTKLLSLVECGFLTMGHLRYVRPVMNKIILLGAQPYAVLVDAKEDVEVGISTSFLTRTGQEIVRAIKLPVDKKELESIAREMEKSLGRTVKVVGMNEVGPYLNGVTKL